MTRYREYITGVVHLPKHFITTGEDSLVLLACKEGSYFRFITGFMRACKDTTPLTCLECIDEMSNRYGEKKT